MAKKIAVIVICCFIFFPRINAQKSDGPGEKINMVMELLENYHIKPVGLDSALSNKIFNEIILRLDPTGLLFTEESVASLSKFRNDLCKKNKDLNSVFIEQLSGIYKARLAFADSLLTNTEFEFKFDINDSIIFYKKQLLLPKDDDEIVLQWKRWIKYGMLKGVVFSLNDTIFQTSISLDSLLASNSYYYVKSKKQEARRIKQKLNPPKGIDVFVLDNYLKTITKCFDPHSEFFSLTEKEKFESSLSRDNYAFGFSLGENMKREIIIADVMPDSPAWYSKEIEKGDVILAIKIPKLEETDLAFADLVEVDEMFNNLEGSKVELTLRGKNDELKQVVLYKAKFDAMINQSFSYVLRGKKRIGYIWFSQFYAEFEQSGIKSSSTDVLREIVKLKEDGMEALILDLRNNPGGSEYETMKIAGYLLGKKPFAIRVNNFGYQILLENTFTNSWYSNPLVVLVNGNSASGSELLSSIIQDYHRGVILGSPTFGKGSEQLVYPISGKQFSPTSFNSRSNSNLYGYVKMTAGMVHRITGKSYQKNGVVPDLLVPNIYEWHQSREADLPYALENDSIIPEFPYQPLPPLPIDSLTKLSDSRKLGSAKFQQISQIIDTLKLFGNETKPVPLNFHHFYSRYKKLENLGNELEKIIDSDVDFEITNTDFDIIRFESDTISMKLNMQVKKNLAKDIYLNEAFLVASDLVDLLKEGKKEE